VAAGSTNAAFNATALAVTTAAKATLTATAGGVSQTDVVQLDAPAAQPATQLEVQLNWDAPASTSDPVVGYNVYRSASGTSNYALVSSSTDTQTSYDDTTVTSGVTYDYIVKSVDSEGVESAPSNTISITVP
jgi:fibronectin type 3 domain-containing protein